MINRVALSLMLTLGTLACNRDGGLKPTAPTTTGFAVTLELSPDPRAVGGFTKHTSIAVALHDGAGLGGALEEASFIVRDWERTVVAESGVTEVVAIPRGGVLRLQRELIIPAGASPGRSLEWRLLIRDGRGELHVVAQTLDV